MSQKQYGLVVAGQGGINNDTATKNFDSREFTFKYLDRKNYNKGVFSIPYTSALLAYPYPTYQIPHNLGYAPSYRFYVYSRDANNDYAQNNHQYELQQVNGSASVINCGAYIDRNNFTVFVRDQFGGVSGAQVYFVFVIGADNLEADADETRYIS